ncbi:hypothetical protein PABG_04290 [Paracoccidioides brasiliensis Pb03]|nr:hypothetical protein PABG_04290 [Paracoccidioides brasiliensis Pb03]
MTVHKRAAPGQRLPGRKAEKIFSGPHRLGTRKPYDLHCSSMMPPTNNAQTVAGAGDTDPLVRADDQITFVSSSSTIQSNR